MALPKGLGINVEKPTRITILNPLTGFPLVDTATQKEAWVEIYSADSPVVKKKQRQITLARIQAAQMRNNRPKEISEDDLVRGEKDEMDTLAALTSDWFLVTLDGEAIGDFPCTPENARDLYSDPSTTWLKDFVDKEASNRTNFAKDSSKS